jgi:GT2 family glycosyltransferase
MSICRYTDFLSVGYTEVTMAINQAIHMFLDANYHTHFLILDIDHVHPVDIVQRLGKWIIHDNNVKIVGGVNHRRGVPYDPCVYEKTDDHKISTIAIDVLEKAKQSGNLVEVDSMGAGCMLIAREVFEAIDPPWWEWDYKRYDKGRARSPDAYFCEKAQEKGFKIWADPSTCSPHIGLSLIDMNTFKAYVDMKSNEGKDAI